MSPHHTWKLHQGYALQNWWELICQTPAPLFFTLKATRRKCEESPPSPLPCSYGASEINIGVHVVRSDKAIQKVSALLHLDIICMKLHLKRIFLKLSIYDIKCVILEFKSNTCGFFYYNCIVFIAVFNYTCCILNTAVSSEPKNTRSGHH